MRSKKTLKMKLPSKDYDKTEDSEKEIQMSGKASRTKRIKEKNIVFPLSNPNKIVFITNQYGNGFRKEKLEDFDCPAHIHVEQMLLEINNVCYQQWKIHHEKLSSLPFEKVQLVLGVINVTVFLLAIIYFTLIVKFKTQGFQILNNLIVSLLFIILILAIYVCFSRRDKEETLDASLVEAIQEKLSEFNKTEQELFSNQARFRWTCHKECLWIALNL